MASSYNLSDLLVDYEDENYSQTADTQQETTILNSQQEDIDEDKKVASLAGPYAAAFNNFLLKPELTRAIIGCGFERSSEVQQACISVATSGVDILCQAKSGTGKTATFVLSTLQQMELTDGVVSVLVLCHTRELAIQTKNTFDRFSSCLPRIKTQAFFGGTPLGPDIEILRD